MRLTHNYRKHCCCSSGVNCIMRCFFVSGHCNGVRRCIPCASHRRDADDLSFAGLDWSARDAPVKHL